jgi:hypothetical protein
MPMLTVRKMPTYRGIFEGGGSLAHSRGASLHVGVRNCTLVETARRRQSGLTARPVAWRRPRVGRLV